MKLIVGLGNPGKEYECTRHNIGFMALDHYLAEASFKVKENYSYFEKIINNEKVIFLKPLTFMNDSGIAVKKVADYYKINVNDILVIHDDMDFETGSFKIKPTGSSAGHNGIKSIIKELSTEDFKRLRIGISKAKYDTVDYVLGRFSKEDLDLINKEFIIIDKVIEDFVSLDFGQLMNKYN